MQRSEEDNGVTWWEIGDLANPMIVEIGCINFVKKMTWLSLTHGTNFQTVDYTLGSRQQIMCMTIHKEIRLIISSSIRDSETKVSTYPGADVGSDHNPLVANAQMKLKFLHKIKHSSRIDQRKIKNCQIKNQLANDLNEELEQLVLSSHEVEKQWKEIKTTIQTVSKKHLQPDTRAKKKKWMTEHILDLMEERRKVKSNRDQYRHIHSQIRREIRKAKQDWMSENCKIMENFEEKHDTFNMHKVIKEVTGNYRRKMPLVLEDNLGIPIIHHLGKVQAWEKYIADLFFLITDHQSLSIMHA